MHSSCLKQKGGTFVDNFGEDIRRQREAKHMTIEDLSQKTKISVAVLKDIENGKFDRYKGDEAYVKMYLKKISSVLSMDMEMLTQQYVELTREIELEELQEKELQHNHNEDIVKKGKKFSFDAPQFTRKPSVYEDKSHVTIIRTIIILALVCLIIVVIWFGFYATRSKDKDPEFVSPKPSVVEGEVVPDQPETPNENADNENSTPSTQTGVEITRNDFLDFSFKLPEGTETFTFRIEFADRSWAEMSVNGQRYSGFESNIYGNNDDDRIVELEFTVADFENLVLKNGYSLGHRYYINDQPLPLLEEDSTPGVTNLVLTLDKE